MSNLVATLLFSLRYTNPSGFQVSLPSDNSQMSVDAAYQAQNVGSLDVPDASGSGVSYTIPFGSIGSEARGVFVQNNTGQPLEVYYAGAMTASYTVAPGGVIIPCWSPGGNGSAPLLQMVLKTTTTQVGAGKIDYGTFGDPM